MALVHFLDINNWYYKEADYERQELMENNYNDIDMVLLAPLSAEAVTRRARALGAAI